MIKICTYCGERKDISEFYKKCQGRDGYTTECKDCILKKQKIRYNDKHDEIRAKQNQYYKEIKQSEERYSHFVEVQAEYQRNHKEQHNIASKKYRKKYPERQREYKQNYIMPPESRTRQREYDRKKYNEDINFRLTNNLRARIWQAIFKPSKGGRKYFKFNEIIGCSKDFLKQYLESKFIEGMSWSNYGEWHIDHIRPCALFDLTDTEQQKQCFHYSNLQPLWAHDNFVKNKKLVA